MSIIASRYARTLVSTIAPRRPLRSRRTAGRPPRSWPPRLTSHLHGPGRVSSKSLMSKFPATAQAEIHLVGVPAQLRRQPGVGRAGEVGRHEQRPAAVQGGGRGEHAPVADGDELGRALRRLLLEQPDRVGPAGRRRPGRLRRRGARLRASLPLTGSAGVSLRRWEMSGSHSAKGSPLLRLLHDPRRYRRRRPGASPRWRPRLQVYVDAGEVAAHRLDVLADVDPVDRGWVTHRCTRRSVLLSAVGVARLG